MLATMQVQRVWQRGECAQGWQRHLGLVQGGHGAGAVRVQLSSVPSEKGERKSGNMSEGFGEREAKIQIIQVFPQPATCWTEPLRALYTYSR